LKNILRAAASVKCRRGDRNADFGAFIADPAGNMVKKTVFFAFPQLK